ncbi:SAM-dependent methyltransferase [Henriciella aquimarina]|uniref:SAM-dependent methyltransferase n=1 Tax=Henriciella aquimarina TaxID=545261 RepID=UPI0009FEB582|nr:cyclopropane-fatty-acyl-phospholipid synthase family protein [Henriciella aquimarina]
MSIWSKSLEAKLPQLIRKGRLRVILPDGRSIEAGPDAVSRVTVRLHSQAWLRRVLVDPALQLGEAYMFGGLTVEEGDMYDFLDLIWKNLDDYSAARWSFGERVMIAGRHMLRRMKQWNDDRKARSNIHHHYDIGNALYRLFLDEDMQYSCAYFPDPAISLDAAQQLKREHITRKLCLEEDQSVLDIGCGWGGLALHIASETGARVEGVTLAEEQLQLARERAASAGLQKQVDFRLEDYRHLNEPYDRVVSVGMLEHVGSPQFRTYFEQVARLMKKAGVALIHTIGRPHGPGDTNPWIAKRIFPGGYIPALSELMPEIERAGLTVTDIEILRLHYAETLKAWRERFMENAKRAEVMYDRNFVRMWEFYLACSEVSFRYGEHVVFQIQLAHNQQAVPLTRDYLYDENTPGAETQANADTVSRSA